MSNKNQATPKMSSKVFNSAIHPTSKPTNRFMRRAVGLSVLAIAALLAACSPTGSATTPTPTTVIGSAPNPASVPTAANATLPSSAAKNAVPQVLAINPLDPCVLIGSDEASTFAGATFGTGVESTTPDGGGKICTYGANTTNVLMVEVAQAADLATAQADEAQFLADIQANVAQLSAGGLNITELPTFADGATLATLNINYGGVTISGGAIGFLKGTIFFGFSDEVQGTTAPSSADVQAEAQTVLGRLP